MSFPSPERPRARSSRLPQSIANDGSPSADIIQAAFGPGSPIFTQTTERLSRIFAQAGAIPPVAARFREWRRCWESVHGQNPPGDQAGQQVFIHQTYLALLARLIARRFVAPSRAISGTEELSEVINVDYFSRRGIGNFGEGDNFSWLPLEPRWELDLDDLVLQTLQGLAEALGPYDFTDARPGILDGLYRQTVPGSRTLPHWLTEYIVEEELGLAFDHALSLLDPACGTGAFLSAAIGAGRRAITERGGDPFDLLFEVPERIKGMDQDPLAVALARLNYLLALGDLVQQEHPPLLAPVYLADAARVPATKPAGPDAAPDSGLQDQVVWLSTPVGEFPLPDPFIENPLMLDWVLGRLTNYMDGAQLRLHVQSEDVAVQTVLNAYYNYLTAGKPRTPVPEALTPAQADILLETARSLVKLHIRGEGSLWLHIVQNTAAPAIFSRRRFDRLVTARGFDRPVASGPGAFFEMCSSLYLKPEGRAAMLMTLDDAASCSAGRRLVDLQGIIPDAGLLVSGREQRAKLELVDGPVADDITWSEAKPGVRVLEID